MVFLQTIAISHGTPAYPFNRKDKMNEVHRAIIETFSAAVTDKNDHEK